MGQGVLVEYLVDGADIAAPVEVDCGIGELDHRGGIVCIDIASNGGGLSMLKSPIEWWGKFNSWTYPMLFRPGCVTN